MREYLPMELEKDERVYGGRDAAVRADMPRTAHERWLEILKAVHRRSPTSPRSRPDAACRC